MNDGILLRNLQTKYAALLLRVVEIVSDRIKVLSNQHKFIFTLKTREFHTTQSTMSGIL